MVLRYNIKTSTGCSKSKLNIKVQIISKVRIDLQPISGPYFLYIPSGNIRKPEVT